MELLTIDLEFWGVRGVRRVCRMRAYVRAALM